MIITRTGSQLSVTLSTGIGYDIAFTNQCHDDATAEAWRVHLQARQGYFSKYQADAHAYELSRIAVLERRNAALRGHLKRWKKAAKRVGVKP